jgi:hypothetical protein
MEESVLSEIPGRKLYSQRGIMISGILAGPVAVGFLMSKNCNALAIPQKKARIWLICLSAFAAIIAFAMMLPPQVPSFIFVFLNAAFGYYATENLQGKQINQHIAAGGSLYSNWRGAGIAFIFAVVFVALFLCVYFAMDSFVNSTIN